MTPIRTAVIGVGSMGRNHARVYSELAEAELVGVADADQKVAEGAGQAFQAPAFQDYRQMLDSVHPQAVTVATPTADHEEIVLAALEYGADVLVEKPIAASVTQARRLIRTAEKLNRLLMVGHIVRFNPAIRALKQKIAEGILGRIYQISTRRVGPFPPRVRDVGVVVDLATHDLDLMRYLTGLEPYRVYAETEQHIHTEHEDSLLGLLRFPDQVSGSLEINWLTPTKIREMMVLGENGLLRVDDLAQALTFYEHPAINLADAVDYRSVPRVGEARLTRIPVQPYEPLKAELQAFLQAVQTGGPAPVSGLDGLAALRLALALVESGQVHRSIEVENDAA
jgi:UDP-N-acetylglucosamine 3-dehydrogenase